MANCGIEKYCSFAMKTRLLANDLPEWVTRHIRRDYIVTATLSAPLWTRASDFRALRAACAELTRITGERYVLDHIVPLRHPFVCGLTVPWNIQVIPHRCNIVKSNHWHPDQATLELVVVPEQGELAF